MLKKKLYCLDKNHTGWSNPNHIDLVWFEFYFKS